MVVERSAVLDECPLVYVAAIAAVAVVVLRRLDLSSRFIALVVSWLVELLLLLQ